MLLHMENNVQVTGRTALKTAFAVSREADAGSIFHPGGNFRVYAPLSQDPGFPLALGAGIGDNAARALTGGTGARNTEEALLVANLSAPGTGTAGHCCFPGR